MRARAAGKTRLPRLGAVPHPSPQPASTAGEHPATTASRQTLLPLHEPSRCRTARASEKRAPTTTVPGARTVTAVQPPGAGATQPAPAVSVQ